MNKSKMNEYIKIQDWFEQEKMKLKEKCVEHKNYVLYQEQLEELLNRYDLKLEKLEKEIG